MGLEKNKICPKCKSKMDEGVVPEGSEEWQKYCLQWCKKVTMMGFGLKDTTNLRAFKCEVCGYIELYAKKG